MKRRMAPDLTFTVDANEMALYASGDARKALILDWIDRAQTTLDLLFYDLADDASGTAIRDALARAAERGVRVRLVIDGFGLRDLEDEDAFFAPIRAAGGTTLVFNARFGRRYLIRNHQKIFIADGERAIIGGANLCDDYLGDHDTAWRDLWLSIEGDATRPLADYFEDVLGWMKTNKAHLRRLSDIVARHSTTRGPLQWQFSAPWPRHTPWPGGLIRDFWDARHVELVMAYFSPSGAFLRRLERVSRDGGTVKLLVPAKSDNTTTIAAARHSYHQLMAAGVTIHEYEKTKMHTKLAVVDDVVHIGSSNFDFRSLFVNMEVMLRIEDADAATKMRGWIADERRDARAITPEVQAQRDTFWARTRWAISNFLVTWLDYTVSRRLNLPLGGGE
ncbi:phospholipase D-like domain-containing protein [Sphingomicrobium sp. XHP0239]|uniref:phospholipase D-like domain-containing protein n=1 Tax=Sphingomicrobium maritimum TaxID=3133972 RepID=UPI0031CC9D38